MTSPEVGREAAICSEEEEEPWGFVASDISDPPQCVQDCRERFLRAVLQLLLPKNETFDELCQALSYKESPLLDALYCCDSQLCGVDNLGGAGQDPNVNWLVTVCQDIGHYSVIDPGPPETPYKCSNDDLISDNDARCGLRRQKATSKEAAAAAAASSAFHLQSLSSSSPPFTMSSFVVAVSPATTSTSTPSFTSAAMTTVTSTLATALTTSTAIVDPSLSADRSTAMSDKEDGQDLDDGKGFSTGIKVTIVLSVVVGLCALLALIVYLLRRRSRNNRSMTAFRRNIGRPKYADPPPRPDSPTALISSRSFSHTDANGVPLTPPPRLTDRRFLATRTSSQSIAATERSIDRVLPASPLSEPTAANLTPRHERTPKLYGGLSTSPPPVSSTAYQCHGGPGAGSSMSSSIASIPTTASVPSNFGVSFEHQTHGSVPSSPSPLRPLRSYDSQIQFHGLPSPGPPPNRALPSTPTSGCMSPRTSSPAPAPRQKEEELGGPRRSSSSSTAEAAAAQNISQPLSETQPDLDLPYDVVTTEAASRESHVSWGSWSAPESTAKVAVTAPPSKKADSPILKESTFYKWFGR